MPSNVDVDNYRLNQYKVETIEQPNGSQRQVVQAIQAYTPPAYDNITTTEVTAGNGIGQMETVTYWLDGVSQMVITITYNANNRISGIARTS